MGNMVSLTRVHVTKNTCAVLQFVDQNTKGKSKMLEIYENILWSARMVYGGV